MAASGVVVVGLERRGGNLALLVISDFVRGDISDQQLRRMQITAG